MLIAIEGYGGSVPVQAFPPPDMNADVAAYEWLRRQPGGAVLELPVGRTREAVRYLYATLLHRHRILNGYSGYGTALQELVGGPPFTELANLDDALRMARAVGLRWLVVHPPSYGDTDFGTRLAEAIGETGHVMRTKRFETTVVIELRPLRTPWPPMVDPAWRELPPDAITVSSSHGRERLPLLLDRDRATRWLSGVRQQGREWIELRFVRAENVARVRLETDRRSWGDYPRGLIVEGSVDGRPAERLFAGGILDRLALSVLHEPRTSAIDLVLPPNQTSVLRLRTDGTSRIMFWSIHEIRVWTR
jgi:hypothetical protein